MGSSKPSVRADVEHAILERGCVSDSQPQTNQPSIVPEDTGAIVPSATAHSQKLAPVADLSKCFLFETIFCESCGLWARLDGEVPGSPFLQAALCHTFGLTLHRAVNQYSM